MTVSFQRKGTYNLPLLICLFLAWVWDFLFLAPHILFLYSAIWKENTKINCSSRFKGMHDVSPIGKYSGTKNKPFIWLIYTATLITSYFLELEIHFFFNDLIIETFASEEVFEFPTFELCTSVQLFLFLLVTETNENGYKINTSIYIENYTHRNQWVKLS